MCEAPEGPFRQKVPVTFSLPTDADTPVIEIDRFSYSFGSKQVLREVSFSVDRGEYLSIVGPNGAGKTTLLKCLNRIYTGGKGEIRINGLPLGSYSQKELARVMSYVPQADGGLLPFTVHEFVMMGRYFARCDESPTKKPSI